MPGKIALLLGDGTPRKSRAEMTALAGLENVSTTILPRGKLSFYEEYPEETAAAVLNALA